MITRNIEVFMKNEISTLDYFLYCELLNSKALQSQAKVISANKNINVIKCQISELNKELSQVIEKIADGNKKLRIEIKLYGLIYPLDSEWKPSLYSFLLEKLNKEDERLEKSDIETAGYCLTLNKIIQGKSAYLNNWEFNSEDIVISNASWACVHFDELSPKLYSEFKKSQLFIARDIENLKQANLSIEELITEVNKIIIKNIPFNLFTNMIQAEISWSDKLNQENKESLDSMINSFFIEDIFAAIKKFENGNANTLLKEYLNPSIDESKRIDLRKNIDLINKSLMPNNQADGSFASKYPLRFSQSFCVNQIIKHYKAEGGFYSVNGPPGTGKTTLLKDIIANIIIQRAKQISKFQTPDETLKFIGNLQKKKYVYALNPSLTGYEIVVASSNNGAVENISKEIPKRDSIDLDMPHCAYFAEYASKLNKEDCWGLLCATLGNSKNKSNFISALCYDEIISQSNKHYAKYCSNIKAPLSKDKPEMTDKIESFKNFLYRVKNTDVSSQWEKAKQEFTKALSKVKSLSDEYTQNCDINMYIKEIKSKQEAIKNLENENKDIDDKLNALNFNSLEESLNNCCLLIKSKETDLDSLNDLIRYHKDLKPGFFAALFNTARNKKWHKKQNDLIKQIEDTIKQISIAKNSKQKIEQNIKFVDSSSKKMADNLEAINIIKSAVSQIQTELALKNPFKYNNNDDKREKSSPFMLNEDGSDTALFKAKKELFVKALKLQELTILANAGKFCTNIGLIEKYLSNNLDKELYKNSDILEIVRSLFFVIPVISTTFASFSRLFSFTQDEFIGYLMIDEAGQAALPATLGALIRSKRAIVVGDPLQLEPVVTIPKNINTALLEYTKANLAFDLYNNSVQTRADMSQFYGTYLNQGETKIWVGSPLRVHNRCNKIMFDISNETTYDGLMIQGKKEKDEINVPSCFIDAKTWEGSDKYCNFNEMQIVKNILQILYSNYEPSVKEDESKYISIVSPFRSVVFALKSMIKSDFSQLSNKITVGTIHTMQGKESRVVIFVLGGKEEGARKWASSKPNLLNVAVTRAKERLIVVGIKNNWENQQYFKVAIDKLPVIDKLGK